VLKDTCSLELANNITHHAPLRFRQSQITPEDLRIHIFNFRQAIATVSIRV